MKKAIVRLRIFLSRIYLNRLQPAKYVYLCRKKCLSGINYQGNKIKYKMENILICFEIYQAEPILIERMRHSHRPNISVWLWHSLRQTGRQLWSWNFYCNKITVTNMKNIRIDYYTGTGGCELVAKLLADKLKNENQFGFQNHSEISFCIQKLV